MKIETVYNESKLAKDFSSPPSVIEEAESRKIEFADELLHLMKQEKVSRAELARLMEVRPSRVTAMLSGNNNFTIETMVRAARAVNAAWHQKLVPCNKRLRWHIWSEEEVHPVFATEDTIDLAHLEFKAFIASQDDFLGAKHEFACDDSRTAA